jgi:hypothetical protein
VCAEVKDERDPAVGAAHLREPLQTFKSAKVTGELASVR